MSVSQTEEMSATLIRGTEWCFSNLSPRIIMFYKASDLEKTMKMFNKQSISRDSRFTKLNPYKWVDGGKSDDKIGIDSNKSCAR